MDNNVRGGDLDSSPAANVLGWWVTSVHLQKANGIPVREPVLCFLNAILKEQWM